MPAHNANLRAEGLLAQWNFPNNYTLSKHLAEYMVADYQQTFNMPVAIVRPTLISSVARDPYPGEHLQAATLRCVPAVLPKTTTIWCHSMNRSLQQCCCNDTHMAVKASPMLGNCPGHLYGTNLGQKLMQAWMICPGPVCKALTVWYCCCVLCRLHGQLCRSCGCHLGLHGRPL